MLRNWTRYGDPSGRITEKILDNAVITLQAQALARLSQCAVKSHGSPVGETKQTHPGTIRSARNHLEG